MSERRHPLFHALVLMGGTVTLGCGGIVGQANGDGSASNTGGAPDSFGAGGHDGVAGSAVFTANGGSGGEAFVPSNGGNGDLSTIQTTGGLEDPIDAGPPTDLLPCVPAQWDCSRAELPCYSPAGYDVQGSYGCSCDASRPTSAEYCEPGQSFVCKQGSFVNDGGTVQVPFECSCVEAATNCGACEEAFGQFAQCSTSPASILCRCAVVYLN